MRKNNILVLTVGFLTCILSTLIHAKNVNNGACSSELKANTACVGLTNTGDVDISIKIALSYEDGVRVATPGKQASYQFRTLHGKEAFVLQPNYNNALLDDSCKLFEWAAQLAQGEQVKVSNLTTGIYSYKFGYKLDIESGRYTMVDCG